MLFASGGSNQLGGITIFPGTRHFISFFLFLSVILTPEDLTSPRIRTRTRNQKLSICTRLLQIPQRRSLCSFPMRLGSGSIPPIYRQFEGHLTYLQWKFPTVHCEFFSSLVCLHSYYWPGQGGNLAF